MKTSIKESVAIQIVAVVGWLWMKPCIYALESYTYGAATVRLLDYFVFAVIGIILGRWLCCREIYRFSRPAFITGAVLFIFWVLCNRNILYNGLFGFRFAYITIIPYIGTMLMALGLTSIKRDIPEIPLGKGLLWSVVLYAFYNVLVFLNYHVPREQWLLVKLFDLAYYGVRLSLLFVMWRTLESIAVRSFLSKIPKLSLCIAGLFWGMFFVMPADIFHPTWRAICMFLASPLIAYIYSVLVRFAVELLSGFVKRTKSQELDWRSVICWWNY